MKSVCIATYNGEKFIKEQIESILSQLDSNDEVIVSDACSTDNTLAVINSIKDARIKVFTQTKHASHSKYPVFEKMDNIRLNFANALNQANGDVIFLADQDDVWKKNKVSRCIELLKEYVCIVHDCEVFDGKDVIQPSFLDYMKPLQGIMGTLVKSPFMGCCMAFRRSVLDSAMPMPDIHVEHDTYIGLCAYRQGKVGVIREPLIKYRRHGGNASPCADKNTNSLWVKFLRRYYMLKSLFFRK